MRIQFLFTFSNFDFVSFYVFMSIKAYFQFHTIELILVIISNLYLCEVRKYIKTIPVIQENLNSRQDLFANEIIKSKNRCKFKKF